MKKMNWRLVSVALLGGTLLAACGNDEDGGNDGLNGNGNGEESAEAEESDADTTTLRLAENHPDDYPTTIGNEAFAENVYEYTDGRYEVEVYAGGQLGEESEVIEQLQLGSLEIARVNSVPLTEFSDDIGVLLMPFLFEDEEQKWDHLLGDAGDDLLDTLDGSGLVGLTYYDSGERSFYNSERPVSSPSDMEGLQIRVQSSDLAIAIVEALGAEATPMEYGEVYSALQTGVIDGAENNFPSYYTSNHYEVAEYFTLAGYQGVPEVVIASEDFWQDLSEEDQEAFEQAARDSVDVQREAWAELTEESREAVIENGNELIEVDDLGEWQDAVEPVYDEFGDEYSEWIERFQQ
ncbi:TRAP transporter substrate-binding protein [Alkalicoccus luteus]|uniref:TRAP transporter substrate-binding protein n=1 Tax=Alkalicoccus luteus TaxID=1237094 RepID=A0A969PQF1_9BACI|nr:TRAP transporter substrate-binding protein [Alkalicoccus luteus]NJP36078.1 TRAP transporter substrate-binding protein [Alkalicoccus luteus]